MTESGKVRLGDYTEPVDTANFVWGKKVEEEDEDQYCEPYTPQELLEAVRKQKLKTEPDGVYDLAAKPAKSPKSPVDASKQLNNNNHDDEDYFEDYNRINHRISGSSCGTPSTVSFDSYSHITNTDWREYDHTSTWMNSHGKPQTPAGGRRGSKEQSAQKAVSMYEDPWDSKRKQREMQNKLQRAHSGPDDKIQQNNYDYELACDINGKSSPSRDKEVTFQRKQSAPVGNYEDAWDTIEKQKQLEERMNAACRSGCVRIKSPTSSPPVLYEAPWDSKQKQKEIEEKLNATHIKRQSGGQSPATSPIHQSSSAGGAYEEAWDIQSKSKIISYLRTNSKPEGDVSHIVWPKSDSPTNKLGAKPNSPCTIGQHINPIIPLKKQAWYHGCISRGQAEQLLTICKEGSYLVRESQSERGQFSLSIKSSRMCIHLRIARRLDGKYILGENSPGFDTVPEMIDHYTRHPVPLKGAEHITLLLPVEELL